MGTLNLTAEEAVEWGKGRPDWYIFPGMLVPDGAGRFLKRPLVSWKTEAVRGDDSDGIRRLWTSAVGMGKAIVAVSCVPSNIWVLDDDTDAGEFTAAIDIELSDVIEHKRTLVLASCTRGRPHYIFKAQGDETPRQGKWARGDVISKGLFFLGDQEPIVDAPIAVATKPLLDLLGSSMKGSGGSGGHGAVSSEEMWDWLGNDHDVILGDRGQRSFLDLLIERFKEEADRGHRRQAALGIVWAAVKEIASGFYDGMDAYQEIRSIYAEMRGRDGSWVHHRMDDFDQMWAGAIAAVEGGEGAEDILTNRERVLGPSDEDIKDLTSSIADTRVLPDGSMFNASTGELIREGNGSVDDGILSGVSSLSEKLTNKFDPINDNNNITLDNTNIIHLKQQDEESFLAPTVVPTLADDSPAYWGPHGELAWGFKGHTEASTVSILASSISMAGMSLIGQGHIRLGGAVHGPNVWVVLTGLSSSSRKSTAISLINQVYYGGGYDDPEHGAVQWWKEHLPAQKRGIGSGEALIREFAPPTKRKGEDEDEFVARLAAYKSNFMLSEDETSVLWNRSSKDGSTLGETLCSVWDSGPLGSNSVTNGSVAVEGGSYAAGFLGAMTEHVARRNIAGRGQVTAFSGFGNRFLWVRLPNNTDDLPRGGTMPWDAIQRYRLDIGIRDKSALTAPRPGSLVDMSPDAWAMWDELYASLKREKGAEGAVSTGMLGRAETQVRRLALNYALAAGESVISLSSLKAGIAFWDHCVASTRYIFNEEDMTKNDHSSMGVSRGNIMELLKIIGNWATFDQLKESASKTTVYRSAAELVRSGVAEVGSYKRMNGKEGKALRLKGVALARTNGGVDVVDVTWGVDL